MALKLAILLEAVDRLSAPLARARAGIASMAAPVRAIAAATGRLGAGGGFDRMAAGLGRVAAGARVAAGEVLRLGGSAAAIAGIGAGIGVAAIGQSALSGAAAMERYRITLTQVEGSAAAADRALAWVSDFATRTPFELAEVTRAFVDIRNLGLDPTRGALAAAGDAAAIMGTRFDEAVQALSAALRGEMDPIERFGVFARTEGNNIVMEWEHQGRRMRAVVDKNNREMIARYIQAAWAQKFGGGMDQLSRSWSGMMSNLADHWSRFQLMVMRAGVFDWLKNRLERVLATLDRMAADGSLQAWAERTASSIINLFNRVERFVLGYERILDPGNMGATERVPGIFERLGNGVTSAREAFDRLRATLEPIIGPFDELDAALVGLLALTTGPLIGGLATLTGGLIALSAALVGTPVGWAILAIGAVAGLGILLYRNWDGVLEWLTRQWEALPAPIQGALRIITAPIRQLIALATAIIENWTPIVDFFTGIGDRIAEALNKAVRAGRALLDLLPRLPSGGRSSTGAVNDPAAQGRRRENNGARRIDGYDDEDGPIRLQSFSPAERVDLGGTLRITIEDGRVTTNGRLNDPRARLDVDQGLLVGAA